MGREIIITAEDDEEAGGKRRAEEATQGILNGAVLPCNGRAAQGAGNAGAPTQAHQRLQQNAPTFAYAIGEYRVDKEGTLTGPASKRW